MTKNVGGGRRIGTVKGKVVKGKVKPLRYNLGPMTEPRDEARDVLAAALHDLDNENGHDYRDGSHRAAHDADAGAILTALAARGYRLAPEPAPDVRALACAICLYVKEGKAEPADTVIEGYAVCYDHMGYVAQGERWASIYRTARADPALHPADPSRREP